MVSGFKCKLRDSNSRPPYLRPRALTTRLYTIHIVPVSRTDKKLLFWIILHKNSFSRKSDFADKGGQVTLQIKAKVYPANCKLFRRIPLVHCMSQRGELVCSFLLKATLTLFFGLTQPLPGPLESWQRFLLVTPKGDLARNAKRKMKNQGRERWRRVSKRKKGTLRGRKRNKESHVHYLGETLSKRDCTEERLSGMGV